MKELDVLLEQFLLDQKGALESGMWPELEAMLDAEDDEIWDWLRNPALPSAAPFHALLTQIRHDDHARVH